MNAISIDTSINGIDEDITIADTIEDINVNTSNDAIDRITIEAYKDEVNTILSGMAHYIAYETLFTDKTLTEVSVSKGKKYTK